MSHSTDPDSGEHWELTRRVRVTMDQVMPDGSWSTTSEIAFMADADRVFDRLAHPQSFGAWWPGHRSIIVGGEVAGAREATEGVEGRMWLHPWRRPRWCFKVVQCDRPRFIRFAYRGALEGIAAWELEVTGPLLVVRHSWYGMRLRSPMFRIEFRLFEARLHHLRVARGLAGLARLHLIR